MKGKKLTVLGFLFVSLIVLALIFFRTGIKEKIVSAFPPLSPKVEPATTEPGKMRTVILFFLSEKDAYLHSEEREIPDRSSVADLARQTVEELIKGSEKGYISPFPPETKLRELYVNDEGVAYVDFSRDIVEKHLSGSSAEISTIYSVVNTLGYNFDGIKKVFILIEGRERETLGGHINLSHPFLPLYDLIAR